MATKFVETAHGSIIETENPEFWKEAKPIGRTEAKRRLKQEAAAELRKLLKPGCTVYGIVRHVSASGMSRRIDFYKIKGNEPYFLTGMIGRVLDLKHSSQGGLVVGGCGMDMIFHVVSSLGYALWPNGTKTPHGTRNGEPDTCGGYALKSAQL